MFMLRTLLKLPRSTSEKPKKPHVLSRMCNAGVVRCALAKQWDKTQSQWSQKCVGLKGLDTDSLVIEHIQSSRAPKTHSEYTELLLRLPKHVLSLPH